MKKQPVVLALCAAALAAGVARADEASEREARALFAEGTQRVTERDFSGALERFQKAYALLPNPKILLNIGTLLRELGREAEAANAYAGYLADPGADPQRRTEVEALLSQLDLKVGRLRILATGADGRVMVDGQAVGKAGAPMLVRVTPGKHLVSFEQAGHPSVTEELAVAAGIERKVNLRSSPALPPAPGHGALVQPKPRQEPIARSPSPPATPSPDTSTSRDVGTRQDEEDPKDVGQPFHAGQVGAVLRADFELRHLGTVTALGLSYGFDRIDIGVSVLIAKDMGMEPAVTVFLLDAPWKPFASVAMPVFFVEGVRPGVRGSLGLQWDQSKWMGFFVQVGAAFFPDVPEGYEKVVVLPSVGVQPRL